MTTNKPIKTRSKASTAKTSKSTRLRKMKVYHQRKSSRTLRLTKQQLTDLEHKISTDIGVFLVLLEQGSPEQVVVASQKARSDFLKLAPDMRKLGVEMGGIFPRLVTEFLDSIDSILHTGVNWIDEGKIKDCYNSTQRLEEALKARSTKETL